MPKARMSQPVYQYSKKVNGMTRYYIRPYINGAQTTIRVNSEGKMWLGRDGYNEALEELRRIRNNPDEFVVQTSVNQAPPTLTYNYDNLKISGLYDMYITSKYNKIDIDSLNTIKHRLTLHFLNTEGDVLVKEYKADRYKWWQDTKIENGYTKSGEQKNYALSFLNAVHSYVNAMFELAVNEQIIEYNPIKKVGKFGTKKQIANERNKRSHRLISYEDYLNLMNETKHDLKFNTLFDLFFSNGPRPGELMAFRWVDYNYEESRLYVNHTMSKKQKGKKRHLKDPKTPASKAPMELDKVLNEKLFRLKQKCMENPNFQETWFIFSKEDPISENSLCYAVDKYFTRLKIEPIRLHDFRHSCASWLISLKLPITVVSAKLRHASVDETMRTYIHLIPKDYYDSMQYINSIKMSAKMSNKTTTRPETRPEYA